MIPRLYIKKSKRKKMEVEWVLVCHGLITLIIVVAFLCGQWPIFQGTPIERLHYFITFGAYDRFLRGVAVVFGSKGTHFVLSIEHFFCDRPNPILQALSNPRMFQNISLPIHMMISYIQRKNVPLVNFENLLGPSTVAYATAVSRALTIIVGGWHFLLCVYGTIALGLVLAGRLKELRVVYILTVYYGIENSFRSLAPHVVQWLLGSYNTQILLMVFLAIVSLLLAGFFGYHANLCLTNTTTNETFKWQEYIGWQRKLNEARTSAAALKASISGMSGEAKHPESKCRAFFRRSPLEGAEVVIKRNMYDKGIFNNLGEIIFPLSTRPSFLRKKSKSG
ncbi:probable protein S-acyltransferase 17 isoform X2 [Ricinus communis]|uniref:probable protein S-acyltransferase 17 isoform X2 n=1 Tax=Ricinus communis TaxID=3988 RepID=UPI00201ADF2E|nr:probable protein S-acyltransferase 17 isoform X2 [Ricinus communis]